MPRSWPEAVPRPISPITVVRDPERAVAEADVINVDVWASMGQEEEQDERLQVFSAYQVNRRACWPRPRRTVLSCTACPPIAARRSPTRSSNRAQCVAFDQAENKMHIHKAILEKLIA